MNPFSLHDHERLLVEALVAGGAAVGALRTFGTGAGARTRLLLTGAAWALPGVLDWVVHAFGFALAGLVVQQGEDVAEGSAFPMPRRSSTKGMTSV